MRLLHKIAIQLIDLAIIAFALFYITVTAYGSEDWVGSAADLLNLTFMVIVVYLVCVIVTEFLCMAINGQGRLFIIARTALTTGFILFLFPKVLTFVLLLMQYQVSADVETVLLYTILIRTIIRAILGRRWQGGTTE
jgi:hypothetical protein